MSDMQVQPATERPQNAPLPDTLPVLIYDEDGLVYAHAIELDLVAHGTTEVEALERLERVVLAQYAAAKHFDDPSLIPFQADPAIVQRHVRARDRLLRRLPPQGDRTASLSLPSDRAIAEYADSLAACPRP